MLCVYVKAAGSFGNYCYVALSNTLRDKMCERFISGKLWMEIEWDSSATIFYVNKLLACINERKARER